MATPKELKYTSTHEWVLIDGNKAKVGLTDYAQHSMGDIVFINLPEVGTSVTAGEAFCDIESVKAVSESYSPLDGKVLAVNSELEDTPELINSDPYTTWIAEIEFTATANLLTADEYDALDKE